MLIDTLCISINNDSFNVFCYADDLILTGLSVTGLQELLDTTSSYIIAHDLNLMQLKPFALLLVPNILKLHQYLNGSVL